MRRTKSLCFAFMLLIVVGFVSTAAGDVKLPGVFGDHMVLQRDEAVPIWGWAEPGEKVIVTLAVQSKATTADEGGRWSVKLDALKAGGPYVLKVQGKNTIEKTDVLVGEVWLCSGQSNMAMTVDRAANKDEEIHAANYPHIRMLQVARDPADTPQNDCKGQWQVCSPDTVGLYSATAYFFGRELHKELNVPIGLINASWGGSKIQAWTSRSLQASIPELKPIVDTFEKAVTAYRPDVVQKRYEKRLADWRKAAAKAKADKQPFKTPRPPVPVEPRRSHHNPGTLYNGMIAPLVPYAIRGAIWYQGESNAEQASLYGLQLKTLIGNWRKDWNQGEFPFLFVQLPNFKTPQQHPSEKSDWAAVREQFVKSLHVSNTGMAITIDLGEVKNIHPRNKQDVGKRLALWALAKTYGKPVVPSGPIYKAMRPNGDKIVIEFSYADSGLAAKGDKLKGFAIAGDDKRFVWADATIEGSTVVVSSPDIKAPVAVRYGWADNPDCNLYNRSGLPASPFRTDDWEE